MSLPLPLPLPEPAVVDLHGTHLSTIAVLLTAHADMRVQVGDLLCEVLDVENDVMNGHATFVVRYNANPLATGAVQPEYLVLTLSPHVTFRVDAAVLEISDYHPAMDGAMILDQSFDGGLKWVPILGVERNERMLTVRFGDPFNADRIDIAV